MQRWAWVTLGVAGVVVVVLAVGSIFSGYFRPTPWKAFAFDLAATTCTAVPETDEFLLLVPIDRIKPDAAVDRVALRDASAIEITGVGVLETRRMAESLTADELRGFREAQSEGGWFGDTYEVPAMLAILVKPTWSLGYHGADGVEILTSPGEPIFSQPLAFRFSVRGATCAL